MKKIEKIILPAFLGLSALIIFGPYYLPVYAQPPIRHQWVQKAKLNKVILNVKSGTIADISGSSFTLHSANGTNYIVTTDTNTRLIKRFGGRANLSEFLENDKVIVTGTIDSNSKTITARSVRDLSSQRLLGYFVGSIVSKGNTSFVLHTYLNGDLTVNFGTATFINKNDQVINYSDIRAGDYIRLNGTWDKNLNQINGVQKIYDLSV
jgi:hypothetical protein